MSVFLHEPGWLWLAATVLFGALALATGSKTLLIPLVSAGLVAAAGLAGIGEGLPTEAVYFAVFNGALSLLVFMLRREKRCSVELATNSKPIGRAPPSGEGEAIDVVGRIARTESGFANGAGRVLIGQHEWPAELAWGEDTVEPGATLRIVGVAGRIKLLVERL